MSSQSSIGEKIAELRKKKGFTQADLGVYLNISYQAVSKWERGESCPDFNTLSRLAQLFNVSISYFEESTPVTVETAVTEKLADVEPLNGEVLGVCKTCGKVVRKGEEGKTTPVLVCKECMEMQKRLAAEKLATAKREEEKKKKQEEHARFVRLDEARKRRNLSFIVAGILGGVLSTIFLLSGLMNWKNEGFGFFLSAFACAVIFGGFTFTYVSQLFWGGAVVDCTLFGGHVIGEPGVIFTLDLDGIAFLIGVKILFAILRFTIYMITLLACVFAAIFISPFTFVPALRRVNSGDLGI